MFLISSRRSGAPKAWRTATYDVRNIYNNPVVGALHIFTLSKYIQYLLINLFINFINL
jgi:hypothetical protein